MQINSKNIILIILVMISLFALALIYTNKEVDLALERTELKLEAKLAEQELLLTTVADLTKQNDADEVTKKIVTDCSSAERVRFDTQLGRLSENLNKTELIELDSLFYKCGRFFADRKAVMATRLLREVSVYREYVDLYTGVLDENDVLLTKIGKWQQIADNEMLLAENFNSLVMYQGDIISALQSGLTPSSEKISETLKLVSETREQMVFLAKQNENIRIEIRSL